MPGEQNSILDQINAATGMQLSTILASIIGSAVSLHFISTLDTWGKRLRAVGIGAAIAYYCAPEVSPFIHLSEGTTGFLTGVFGVSLLSAIFSAINQTDFASLIGDFFSRLMDKWFGAADIAEVEKPSDPQE